MRRPIVFLFLFFTLGIALEYHLMLAPFWFMAAAIFSAAGYALALIFKRHQMRMKLISLFLLVTLLGSAYFFLAENRSDPLEAMAGKTCTVEGRIITIQKKDEDSYKMLITAENAGKRLAEVKGTIENPEDAIGKWAVMDGIVVLPSERRNPNLFDYRLYLKTKDVRIMIQTDSGHITLSQGNSSILSSSVAHLKYGFLHKLEKTMSPEAFGLMAGMLFGDRSFLGEETYEMFQKNGIAHILSVSGIHVGIVYLYISRLLGSRKTRSFYFFTAAGLFFYAALSQFSPSVIRAMVMIFIHMFSKVAYRRYDFISCASASAIAMLLVNPFYLFNIGFQLSFLAVFCLSVMLPWANRKINDMEERGKSERLIQGLRFLAPLLVIQVGMAPMTAYLFNYFSAASFFINIPILAISGIIIPLGICLIPLSFLGGLPFGVGAQAAELFINAMIWINKLFFFPGIGFFNMVSPPIFILLLFYGFFFFLSSEFLRVLYQRKRMKEIILCCSLVIALSLLIPMAAGMGDPKGELVFVDVGQGDCLHIRTPEGKNILIDGGGSRSYSVGKKILLPYLLKSGVKSIDLAIATHLHEDHYLGMVQLAKDMKIDRFGVYEANRLREREILSDTGFHKQDLLYLAQGDRIRIEKDIWIDVLYPEERSVGEYEKLILIEEDENRSSLLLKVYYKGLTVLMTGDIGLEGEQEIIAAYQSNPDRLDADILKIGHHGSRYSTGDSFLDVVSPEVAVFQVGKNNFGHPHPTIIDKCRKKGIIIYRNDLDGAIIFEEEERIWHIETLLRRNMHTKKLIRR